jgi:hypothetical protein
MSHNVYSECNNIYPNTLSVEAHLLTEMENKVSHTIEWAEACLVDKWALYISAQSSKKTRKENSLQD